MSADKKTPSAMVIPMVVKKDNLGERAYDIYSRLLVDRIVILGSVINDDVANIIVAEMLFLSAESADDTITLWVNSPGGSVTAGLAIVDVMKHLQKKGMKIETICLGQAASMGAVILAAGTKGSRRVMPHARVMIHQPSGGAEGKSTDIEIIAKEIVRARDTLNQLLAEASGKTVEEIAAASKDDNFMSAAEAVAFGLADIVGE